MHDDEKRGMSIAPMVTAIVGAAVGTLFGMVMSKPENREKVRKTFAELKRQGMHTLEDAKVKLQDFGKVAKERIEHEKKKAQKSLSEVKRR